MEASRNAVLRLREKVDRLDYLEGRPAVFKFLLNADLWGNRADPFPDHTFECWVDTCPVAPCVGPDPSQEAWWRYDAHGALPTNVVIDSGGRVVYTGAGFDSTTIQSKLDAMVGTAASCLH